MCVLCTCAVTQRIEQGGSTQITRSAEEWAISPHPSVTVKSSCEEDSRGRVACKQHWLTMWRMDNSMARGLR